MGVGPPEVHEVMTAIRKILEEKLACRYKPKASDLSQQKEELQAQVNLTRDLPPTTGLSLTHLMRNGQVSSAATKKKETKRKKH